MTPAENGQRIGYIRVSSVDQSTIRQLDGVQLDRTFTDKASGKDVNRPELKTALGFVRAGDVLVVHSIDRLARNLADLLAIVKELNARGVAVEFCKEKLSFSGDDSPSSKLMLSVMGACAEFERSMIRERQLEGIALAKKAGVYKGRKSTMTNMQVKAIRDRVSAGENKSALGREFGITRQTIYNLLASK